ncbi:sensor histidine kinase (plasmid) [Pseudoalteromonas sp. T1lg65]|uniref:sensor histidine kinase n=1 Tax=Pseudoalteromonas sp. T1lg65 TaxID=2077101 RepID=UPI003F795B7E
MQTILENIDIAILAVDSEQKIQLFNLAAGKLFSINDSHIAKPLTNILEPLQSLPAGQSQLIELPVEGQTRRFNLHTQQYMSEGNAYTLIFLNDVHALLRNEERLAWQRLVRVMSHEINNSLSPIASISQTLAKLVSKQPDFAIKANLVDNLTFVHERATNLGHFIEGYNQLARLPEPNKQPYELKKLLNDCQKPFSHCQFTIIPNTDITLSIDPVQIEQLLINLFKNADESAQSQGRSTEITIDWQIEQAQLTLSICDNGVGISNSENLFVPFYSTKKHGSGIGLVLCQQIAEAYLGRLSLHNRNDTSGCCAKLSLPIG